MLGKACLIDTGVLVRFFAEDDPLSELVVSAIGKLISQDLLIAFTPQVVRESWSVLTRPRDVGGYGLTAAMASAEIERAHAGLIFLADTAEIYPNWLKLVRDYGVSGRQVHDAYHVAAMIAHGVPSLLTLNGRDFARYTEIRVMHSADI